MNESQVLIEATALAKHLHTGQRDKMDKPYTDHLERVANMVRRSGGSQLQEAAAWLHESLEDTTTTFPLLSLLFPAVLVRLVEALTHYENEPYPSYWERVKAEPAVVLVKLCDIHDNLDPSPMCILDAANQKRMRSKYAMAMITLVE